MMTPQRARTYCWLFAAMSVSVCANLLLFQPGRNVASGADSRVMHAGAAGAHDAGQVADTVRAIQRELKELRLYPGQVDGKPSPLVHAAIVAYEQAQALPITGEPTQALLRDMIVGPSAIAAPPSGQGFGVAPGTAAERLRATRLGKRHKAEPVVRAATPRGETVYWVGAAGSAQDAGEGTDFHATAAGCVSVTPLQVDLTRFAQMEPVSHWLGLKT